MWDEVDQNASLPYLDPAYYEDQYPAVSPSDVFSSDYSGYDSREAPDSKRTTRSFLGKKFVDDWRELINAHSVSFLLLSRGQLLETFQVAI